MYTDMVGYTALGQRNESLSLALVEEQRKLIRPILSRHNGREIKTMGDAFMVEFANALDAVRCAYDIQRASREFNFSQPDDRRIKLRIGLHVGDVEESNGDIFGDAVNVASRVEPLAPEGCVCLTQQVYDQVANKFDLPILAMGRRKLKNVATPVRIYRIAMPWEREPDVKAQGLDVLRVAVLPFANMSPDPQDEYFADGLTEELISTMSKMSELKVISRTSVMQYKDKSKPMGEIGRELKAGTILEGSVRKASGRVRVTIQMVDSKNDLHLWAESYDREFKDIFAIQSDIAQQVATALKVQLLSREKRDIEKRPTENMDAYQLYLKGRYHFNREQTKEDQAKALNYFEEAIKLDSRFALPYSGISDYYHSGSHMNWFSPEEAFPKMKEYATRALQFDPRLAEGHAALGAVYFHYEWNWKAAEKEFSQAIELRPSYDLAYQMYHYLLAILGRYEESYELAKRGSYISPPYGARGWGGTLASAALRLGRIQEGVARLEEIVKADPDLAGAHDSLGFAYYQASRMQDAISEVRKAMALSQGDLIFKADLASLLALEGQRYEANSILDELLQASKSTYVSNVQVGLILYNLGRHDEAFDNLERAYERRAIDLPDVRVWPHSSEIRSEPKWISIESRMGLRNS